VLRKVKKLVLDPRKDSDQHQNLTTSRWSPLVHAFHVWSTSVTRSWIIARRMTDR